MPQSCFETPFHYTIFVLGIIDSSGLRFHYTSQLRKYQAATLSVGLSVPGSLYIPPYQDNWVTEGYCAEECTAEVCVSGIIYFNVYIVTANNVIAADLKQESSMAAV